MFDLEYSANGNQCVCYLLSNKSRDRMRQMLPTETMNDFFACTRDFFTRFSPGLKGKEVTYGEIHEHDPWRLK